MNLIYGTRYNILKKDFESLLSSLKSAGADLFFVSKSAPGADKLEHIFTSLDRHYEVGLEFIEKGSKNHVPVVIIL